MPGEKRKFDDYEYDELIDYIDELNIHIEVDDNKKKKLKTDETNQTILSFLIAAPHPLLVAQLIEKTNVKIIEENKEILNQELVFEKELLNPRDIASKRNFFGIDKQLKDVGANVGGRYSLFHPSASESENSNPVTNDEPSSTNTYSS